MRMLIFGHSYVKDLQKLNVTEILLEQKTLEVVYKVFPEAGFQEYINDPTLFEEALQCSPDIVVAVVGGDSIERDVLNRELFRKCRTFYELLRSHVPNAIIIAAQIEARFYEDRRKFHDKPQRDLFEQKRKALNRYLNRLKVKDNMLIIAGPGRLDNSSYYRSEYRLNSAGIRLYMSIIKTTIQHAYEKRFKFIN